MPILSQLTADHDEFRNLGRALESLLRTPGAPAGEVAELVARFGEKMRAHAKVEDEIFYPAIRREMARSTFINDTYMNHLDHEHKSIDGHLERLAADVSGDRLASGWGQTFAIFSVGLRGHMRREEEELFPEAMRLLGPTF